MLWYEKLQMRNSFRKFIFIIALLAFFVITPIIILYAIGYRPDFNNKSLKKVGMLIIESKPDKANVFINNKLGAEKTPYKIKNLMPGDYEIKISKDGFSGWSKKLSIRSKEVNWASHILLFFEKPKIKNLTTLAVSKITISEQKDKIAYSVTSGDNIGIWFLTLKTILNNEENQKIFPENEEELKKIGDLNNIEFSDIKFSPDGQKLLLASNKTEYILIDINQKNAIFLSDYFKENIENIKWDMNNNLVFFESNNNLYQFDIQAKSISKTPALNILDYALHANKIFYLSKDIKKNKIVLNEIDKNNINDKKPKIISRLKFSNNFLIKASPRGYLAYLDRENNKFYLYKNGEEKIISQEKINDFYWSRKGNRLLYFNEHEVWFYSIVSEASEETKWHPEYNLNTQNLLIRTSEKIENPAFYDEEHVIFLQNEKLKNIELDERDKRNTYELEAQPNDAVFFIGKKGENIYFINEDTKNLVEMGITKN